MFTSPWNDRSVLVSFQALVSSRQLSGVFLPEQVEKLEEEVNWDFLFGEQMSFFLVQEVYLRKNGWVFFAQLPLFVREVGKLKDYSFLM